MLDITKPEVAFALETVRTTAMLVKQVQLDMVGGGSLTKDDKSPVTIADYAAQAIVGKLLKDAFPDDVLIGEEDSSVLRTPEEAATLDWITSFVQQVLPEADSEAVCTWIDYGSASSGDRYWTVDPIDGTKGFLRGDQYAVALALVEDGEIKVGALGCPNLTNAYIPEPNGPGSLVLAVRGQGTWSMPLADEDAVLTRLHVSERDELPQARLLRSFESGHTNTGQIGQIVETHDITAEPVRMDSQAKYAVLAAGKGDALVRLLSPKKPDYREKIWDQAAGAIVIEEAGGKITDLSGTRLDFTQGRTLANNRGVLATNGALHDTLLAALKDIGA
jgi:3'(2'), 5'-bisphosphate nucleotidase